MSCKRLKKSLKRRNRGGTEWPSRGAKATSVIMTNSLEATSISNLRQISDSGLPEARWGGSPLQDLAEPREVLGCRGQLAFDLGPFPPRPCTGAKGCGLSRTWQGLSMSRSRRTCPPREVKPKLAIDSCSIPRLSPADQRRFYFLPFSSRKQVRSSLCPADSGPLDRRKLQCFQAVPRIHARWRGQLQRGSPKHLQLRL